MVEMKAVESSNISQVGYDVLAKELHVMFHSGTIYKYKEVSKELYESFLQSESKGKFFNQNVKVSFKFEKVVLPVPPILDKNLNEEKK